MNKKMQAEAVSADDSGKMFTGGISRPAKLADQLYEEILQQLVSGKLSEGTVPRFQYEARRVNPVGTRAYGAVIAPRS